MSTPDCCPSVGDLIELALRDESVAHTHACPRCAALLHALVGVTAPAGAGPRPISTYAPAVSRSAMAFGASTIDAAQVEMGQVYAIRSLELEELEFALVISTPKHGELTVAGMSSFEHPADRRDVAVDGLRLGFQTLIHRSITGPVLTEQLDAMLGTLPVEDLADEGIGGFAGRRDPDEREVAPARSDEEMRNVLELRERWRAFFEPAVSLRETRTLGELLARRQQYLGLSVSEVAAVSEFTEPELVNLNADEVDLLREVEPKRLAALMRALSMLFGVKLAERVRLTLAYSMATPSNPGVVARRTRRAGTGQFSQECDRYLARLRQEMGC